MLSTTARGQQSAAAGNFLSFELSASSTSMVCTTCHVVVDSAGAERVGAPISRHSNNRFDEAGKEPLLMDDTPLPIENVP